MIKRDWIALIFILATIGLCLSLLLSPAQNPPDPGHSGTPSHDAYTRGPVGTTDTACLPPAILAALDTAWANQSPILTENFRTGLSRGEVAVLYDIQIQTQNLLDEVAICHDSARLNELVTLYNISYEYTTVTPDGYREWIYYSTGKEDELSGLQYLYLVSRTLNIISAIDEPDRTPEMNAFVANFGPVAVESYTRWQPEYQNLVERKLKTPNRYSIDDKELWLSAGIVELLAAGQHNPAIEISDGQRRAMMEYVNRTNDLIRSQATETNLIDFKGLPVKGIIIDYGLAQNTTDYRFACYNGTSFPLSNQTCRAKTGWDISHGRRFVQVFETLHNNRNITGSEFPDDEFMIRMANELVYGSSNRNITKPLFTNYIGGVNGWYRAGYKDRTDFGYPPYGLSVSVPVGGYGYWASYNRDMGILMQSLLELSESRDPFMREYYKPLQTDLGKIEFLPTFARTA
jgi:hypothetical protein